MDIEIASKEAIKLSSKKGSLWFLPFADASKPSADKMLAVLSAHTRDNFESIPGLLIDGPGEYEVEDISIQAVAAVAGDVRVVLFRVTAPDGITIVLMPAVPASALTDEVLESLGPAQVLVLALDRESDGALIETAKAARLISPRAVIPFAPKLPQAEMDKFLAELGGSISSDEKVFKTKSLADTPEGIQIYLLQSAK